MSDDLALYEAGYDVVGEIDDEIGAVKQAAMARGVALPQKAAQAIAVRNVQMRRLAQPRQQVARTPMAPGRGSGMTTSCPLGTATFAAASPAGTIVNLAPRAEEPMVAARFVLNRYDYALIMPPACAGIPVLVMNVQIGMRSVFASAAGEPVENFGPQGTGGQLLAGGVRIERATLIQVQFQQGPVAIPAGEAIYVSGAIHGAE